MPVQYYGWIWHIHDERVILTTSNLGLLFCDQYFGMISSMGDNCDDNGGEVNSQMFPIWFFKEPMLEDVCRGMKYNMKYKMKCVY